MECCESSRKGRTTQVIKQLDKVHKPSYILATPQHTLYISSFLLDQVLFVSDTRHSGVPAITFTQGHGLDGPWGMVADDKYLYVASFATDQIHKYDLQTGKFVGAFGNESYLDCPEGMARGPNNTIYVASFLDDRVVKFSLPDGKFLGVVANKSHGLKGPEDVAFLPDGSLLICSHYSDTVLRFNSFSGEKLGVFARVEKPVGLTVGSDGHVYVTSYVTNSILRFNGQTGDFMDVYAAGGGLQGPSSVSFADVRTLYAASYDSDRVVEFNSTSGITYTLPGKRHEHHGNGSFRNATHQR